MAHQNMAIMAVLCVCLLSIYISSFSVVTLLLWALPQDEVRSGYGTGNELDISGNLFYQQ